MAGSTQEIAVTRAAMALRLLSVLALVTPAASVPYTCICRACYFSAGYTEGTDFKYHVQSGTITRDQCKVACSADAKCTGIEHPNSNSYCAFWLGGACGLGTSGDVSTSNKWADGMTCSKGVSGSTSGAMHAAATFAFLLGGMHLAMTA